MHACRIIAAVGILGGLFPIATGQEGAGADGPPAELTRALAERPYDTGLYQKMYADAAGRMDGAEAQLHWGKWLHWCHDYGGDRARADAIGAELKVVDPAWDRDREIISRWRGAVLQAADKASRARDYRIAGHLLGKLLDLDPGDVELSEAFDKLYEKAGESATGGAFTAERVRRKSPEWITSQNRKHASWADAFSRRTKHYKIITNISYEFFETVSVVMEDMYDFYQSIFDYKKSAPTVTLAIHRKRSDFDKYCIEELGSSLGLGTGGWFAHEAMTVAAYDRSESGQDLTDVYRVLFHEASHQFMYLITKKKTKIDPPTWLNEGTASYFEGCELKADGSIVKNKPALNRVSEWESIDSSDSAHSLKELITVAHRGYDGSYYSYGWSLVYFLNNYEDDKGVQIYRPAYLDYLQSYTKKGAKDEKEQASEAFDRAVKYFVDDIADPAVPDWNAFEARWRAFTQNVVAESKRGADFADVLHERCRRYLERRDFGRALILAEQADDRRPDDKETYRLLALANAGLDRDSDAAHWMLLHWELAWKTGDEASKAAAEKWLGENQRDDLLALYCAASEAALAETLKAMDEVVGGHPSLALLFASHALRAFGIDHPKLVTRMSEIQALCQQDLRLWQNAYVLDASNNRNWDGVDLVRFEHDGVLINNPADFGRPMEVCDRSGLANLEPPFEVRGRVTVEGEGSAYLLFGLGRTGRPQAGISFARTKSGPRVAIERIDASTDASGSSFTTFTFAASKYVDVKDAIPFELDVRRDGGELRVAGEALPIPAGWEYGRFEGRMALTTEDATIALFSDVKVRPGRPFWPVEFEDSEE
jgi:hypothetical protein